MRRGESLAKKFTAKILNRRNLRKPLGLASAPRGQEITLHELLVKLEKSGPKLTRIIQSKDPDLEMTILIREEELTPDVAQQVIRRKKLRQQLGLVSNVYTEKIAKTTLEQVIQTAETLEASLLNILFAEDIYADPDNLSRIDTRGMSQAFKLALVAAHLRIAYPFHDEPFENQATYVARFKTEVPVLGQALRDPLWEFFPHDSASQGRFAAQVIKELFPDNFVEPEGVRELFLAEAIDGLLPQIFEPVFVVEAGRRLVPDASPASFGKFLGVVAANLCEGYAFFDNSMEFLTSVGEEGKLKLRPGQAGKFFGSAVREIFESEQFQRKALELLAGRLCNSHRQKAAFLKASTANMVLAQPLVFATSNPEGAGITLGLELRKEGAPDVKKWAEATAWEAEKKFVDPRDRRSRDIIFIAAVASTLRFSGLPQLVDFLWRVERHLTEEKGRQVGRVIARLRKDEEDPLRRDLLKILIGRFAPSSAGEIITLAVKGFGSKYRSGSRLRVGLVVSLGQEKYQGDAQKLRRYLEAVEKSNRLERNSLAQQIMSE